MSLYNIDYGLWLQSQIDNLRCHNWDYLDINNLVEELEGLNKSNKRELYSYTVVALTHLLKWKLQPQFRSGSWRGSINNSRKRMQRVFKDQPSLKPYLDEILSEAYDEAKELASSETGFSLHTFPSDCIFSIFQILDFEFLPE